MKWKSKLKKVLAETAKPKKTEIYLKNALTKTDKTSLNLVSSVFVSDKLRHFSKKMQNMRLLPNCSNCDLQMIFIQNENIWFCPLGCESKPFQ